MTKIIYGEKYSSFNELLENGNSASIRYKRLLTLAIEMYKISDNISSTVINDIFAPRSTPYNLQNPLSSKMRPLGLQ